MTPNLELAVLSDVHIRDCYDPKIQKISSLFQWLVEKNCKTVVLNGDIFDVFIASPFFVRHYKEFFTALEQLSQKCQVIYIQGNHEFFLTKLRQHGVQTYADNVYSHETTQGRIYIAHGDHLHPGKIYHALRSLLRHPITYLASRLLPGSWVNQICLGISDLSKHRNHDREKTLPHQKILQAVHTDSQQHNCKISVVGHYHTPWAQDIDGHLIYGLSSWQEPNALVFNAAGAWRVQPESDEAWAMSRPKPLLI